MDQFVKDVKDGWGAGTALGGTTAAIYRVVSNFADGLEPCCREGLETAQTGAIAGGVVGATALGTLNVLKTTRHAVHKVHQYCNKYHSNLHNSNDTRILCKPNDIICMD